MQSTDYQLAEALVTRIAAALPAYPCELVGDPRAERKTMTDLRILVRPASWAQESQTREYDVDNREVHVGVVSPCNASDLSALDACLAVCDQVRALWGRDGALRFAAVSGHTMVGVRQQSPIWDERMLLESNLFVGTITIKYAACS